MYLQEVDGPWNENYIVWKASFSVIFDVLEYEINREELNEVYFGMPRHFYNKPGNNRPDGQAITLRFQGMPSRMDDNGWNVGVFTDNGRQ